MMMGVYSWKKAVSLLNKMMGWSIIAGGLLVEQQGTRWRKWSSIQERLQLPTSCSVMMNNNGSFNALESADTVGFKYLCIHVMVFAAEARGVLFNIGHFNIDRFWNIDFKGFQPFIHYFLYKSWILLLCILNWSQCCSTDSASWFTLIQKTFSVASRQR